MKAEEEQRLDDFLRVLVSMTDGDFGPRIPLLGDDSPCEAVAAAINILADELQAREEQQEGLHMGRVRDVLEATPDVIAIADTNRHIVFMNRAARRVLKIPPGEDPKGSNLSRMFTPRGGSVFLTQALPEALRTHQWTGEIALQDREGTPIPVSMVVLAHHDHHGRHDYLATIGRDISDLKALEQERERHVQAIVTVQSEERRRIARELHDGVSQQLASILVGLQSLTQAPSLEDVRSQAAHIIGLTSETLEDLGRIARGLHPGVLEDLGLSAAIKRFALEYGRVYGVRTYVKLDEIDRSSTISEATSLTLYRIAQEALLNAARHGHAKDVSIIGTRGHNEVRMVVEDDGCGFDVDATLSGDQRRGMGLRSMGERLALLGGELTIESTPGRGTALFARMPEGVIA